MPDSAATIELPPVQLTRMEGILNLINYKVDALAPRVDQHEGDIADLKLSVQRLGDEAGAREVTVVATAKALREAKEATDAEARAEVLRSEARWSPAAKLLAIVAGVSSVATIYLALHGAR